MRTGGSQYSNISTNRTSIAHREYSSSRHRAPQRKINLSEKPNLNVFQMSKEPISRPRYRDPAINSKRGSLTHSQLSSNSKQRTVRKINSSRLNSSVMSNRSQVSRGSSRKIKLNIGSSRKGSEIFISQPIAP